MDGTEDGANGFDEEDLRGQDGAADEDGAEDRQLVHTMHETQDSLTRTGITKIKIRESAPMPLPSFDSYYLLR